MTFFCMKFSSLVRLDFRTDINYANQEDVQESAMNAAMSFPRHEIINFVVFKCTRY